MTSSITSIRTEQRCILCGSDRVIVAGRIPAARVRELWKERMSIDLVDEPWRGLDEIRAYQCPSCGFEFFPPALAGSDRLYEQLQRFDWYYMPVKWEHDVALADIPKGARVLEVGCATGAFVERLCTMGLDAAGIELNQAAVTEGRSLGRRVRHESLADVLAREPGSYDVVCSFQVLEHVPDPRSFLEESAKLLCPGGRLIFCVPHADSFIRREFNPLDMPPHHVSRWTRRAIEGLEGLLGLSLVRIVEEPLATYHIMGYLAANWRKYRAIPGGLLVANPLVYRAVAGFLRVTGLHRRLQGQSIYACLQRAQGVGSA